uniref:G-patch domain-containing protein n=1 Tax=Fagus sylvatica TaxID=28930 RepID=A0A2N9GDP3_FAGSY
MAEEASKLRGLEGSGGGIRNQAVPDRASAVPATANPSPTTIYLADQEEDDYALSSQRTRIGPQPKDYNKDLTCEYHQGEVGHTVENCRVLRHRIQDLLDQGVLKFRIEGVINTIGAEKDEEVDITSTKIPWEPLFHELKKRGLLPAPRAPKESTEAGTCQYHPGARDHNLQGCEEFKKEVAGLITKGLIRRRGEQPERDCMTIDQLRLSPYEKTNFQARMERIEEDFEKFCERKKEELGKAHTSHTTGNVRARSSGHPLCYQRKGRASDSFGIRGSIFGESSKRGDPSSATLPLPRQKEAGKAVEDPTKTKAAEEEAADFLRIIKSSEYSIVKQLSKMPSHISVLSLLLASESHRKALLKVLNEAYVPEDITGPSFENMVTSILVTNQLTFSDDELPPEGRALNVCPLSTLEKLDIDPTRVRVNSMVVRAFDGTRREVLGEIDLPVEIGPQVYDINFQVLRIDSPYNLLLGRPWLHTAGAVPSSLHQKMKLIIGNQLVTILAEEPISIYNDGEIPYIDGCAPEEASFHSFEFVTVIHRVAAVEPRLSKAGIMVAKEFVKAGFQPGQGLGYANQGRTTIVTLEGNKDRYGLGYTPTRRDRQMAYEARRQRAAAKLKGEKWPERKMAIPHIRTTFPASAMFQVDEGDVDELALLFTEDLNVNAITTEGDSAAFPVHADQHEEIDLEDFLDEENLKGYRIDEETLDEDTWEDDDLPDLLPHLMVPRGLDTLEFEIFCEHGDPESHLRKYREKMALHTNNEFLMISTFHESLPECAVTWFYQLKNLACWGDLAKSFPGPIPPQHQGTTTKQIITTTVAEEEYAGPMVEGLSIHTIAEEEDSTTTPPTRHCQQGEEVKTWTCVPLLQRVSSSNDQNASPSKQALRRMKPEVILKIKEEVEKQLKAGFLSTVTYSDWVANIVPVPKEGRKSQNQRTSYSHSWTDSQGTIRSRWPKKTSPRPAFVTHWGTFVYDVMPFGLKNAGATYQRAMVTLFHDMIHHEIETARRAFDKIKEYLLNPPILVPPTPGRPLILYLTVQEASMGCMLGQQDETGKKEQAIYYLSKKFTEPETRYLLVEKTCCALAWASKKLRQYMLYYTTWLAIKGQAIADYLADYPSEQLELMDSEFPDEDVMTVDEDNHGRWKLYFDGAANAVGSGIGAVLVSPKGQQTPIATNGEWQARDPKLIPYQRYISRLVPKFKYVTFTYTPRAHNHFADALATLASLIKLVEGDDVRPLRIETRDIPAYCVCIEECMNVEAEIDDKPWYYDIKRFIQDREYPSRATENEKKYIRRMAFQFFLSGEILYKRTHDATLLRCVDAEEANRLIQEMHAGLMGAHANGPFLARKIMRAGYYWLTMERDCIRHVQTCHKCQMYQNSKNAPPQYLHTMASPWPFSAWGMDVIGAITPKASNGHEFILVAIDYFTKTTSSAVTECQKMLITDNASNLNNRMMDQLCQQFKIQHHNSAPYRPKMNGAVEAANKNVKKILSKMTETYKDWHEHLPYALCAYRTSVRTSVGATPYSLVYGMEAVLPVEVEIPSLRILSQTQLEEAEWAQARYEQLNFIDEKRLAALCHGQLLPETDRKSLQQEGSTSHFPTRRSRSEEEEYGPIRSTRKVRTII